MTDWGERDRFWAEKGRGEKAGCQGGRSWKEIRGKTTGKGKERERDSKSLLTPVTFSRV